MKYPTASHLSLIHKLLSLVLNFEKTDQVSPTEYIKYITQNTKMNDKKQQIFKNFLFIMQHRDFLNDLACNFDPKNNPNSKRLTTIVIFLIVFILNKTNYENLMEDFVNTKIKNTTEIIEYFTKEENLIDVVLIAAKQYEHEYIIETILNPILNKKELLENLLIDIKKINAYKTKSKSYSIPQGPALLNRPKALPLVPVNTPIIVKYNFRKTPIPETTYIGDTKCRKKIEEAHIINRQKAERLLDEIQDNGFACAKNFTKPVELATNEPISFKAKRAPRITQNVEIKPNTTSLMREASLLSKYLKEEIEKINNLTCAIVYPETTEEIEKQIWRSKMQQEIENIQKKHLQGQLSYERALLAKKELLNANKVRVEEFKKEKLRCLQETEEWHKQEQLKIKEQVEKCQEILENAKKAKVRNIEDKKLQAQNVKNESKKHRREIFLANHIELEKKVKLIQEMRAVHQVLKTQCENKMDKIDFPKNGLLNEMSIVELQERLILLKAEMEAQLQKRKQAIRETKTREKNLLENMKNFIKCQRKIPKKPTTSKISLQFDSNPELNSLREHLEKIKKLRMT